VNKEKREILENTPLRRFGSPKDIAQAVKFLITGTDFATGSVLIVDGGRLIA
jgi:NAD(P)-dependent dehydrogenase (short-subunit alcohol dehydrogenase family)